MGAVLSCVGPEVLGTVVGFTIIFDPDGGKIRLDLGFAHQLEGFLKLDASKIGGMALFTRILGPDGEELYEGYSLNFVPGSTQAHREECIDGCGKKVWFLGCRPTGNFTYGGFLCSDCRSKRSI